VLGAARAAIDAPAQRGWLQRLGDAIRAALLMTPARNSHVNP